MATTQRIRYDLEASVSGEQDVAALARQLEGLADTLEGDLKTQALASAQALRELGAKQGAIDSFIKLKGEAGEAAARLEDAQQAAQRLAREMAAGNAPTRAQAGQLEKLRDAVRTAKTELQSQTAALDQSRDALNRYGIGTSNLAQSQRNVKAAIAGARAELAGMAPAYSAAGSAAAASGQQQTQAARSVRGELSSLSDQLATLRNIAGAALGGTLIGSLAQDLGQVADGYANVAARVKLATDGNEGFEQGMADVQRIAQTTNTELEATAGLYATLTRTGREAGLSARAAQQEAASLTEVINQSIQLSGAGAQAAQAAVTQLIQGLQSGVLRGEEFNSVVEQSPRLARALADGLGVTIGQLREMAKQGQLTAEVVRGALGGQAQEIQREFEQLPPTIGRAIQSLSNAWTVYVGETDRATGASRAAAEAIGYLARNLDTIAGLLIDVGQAAAAFTALRLAQSFLAVGAAATTAAAGVTATAVAMRTAEAASVGAAAGAGRLASMLGTLRTFTLVGLLANIKDIGTWLGESVAKLMGYRDASDEVAAADRRAAAAAEENRKAQAAMAQQLQLAAEAARGLTPAARELVGEFDKARESGKGVADALAQIAKNANLSDTQGISSFTIALRDMAVQGKAAGDEVRNALAQALKGEDLQAFEVRARAAFAGTKNEAELLALAMDAQLRAAVERAGLSFGRITSGMSEAARSAINDTQSIIDGLDRLKGQGADVALALTASIGKGINTADSQAAFEALRGQVEAVRRVLGDRAADTFLQQIEDKARDAAAEVGGLGDALRQLGITSDQDLKRAADAARNLYERVRESGGSAREQAEAFQRMADAAIRSGDATAIAFARSQAAANGFEVAADRAGQTVVRRMGEAAQATERYRGTIQQATQDVQEHVGWLDRLNERNSRVGQTPQSGRQGPNGEELGEGVTPVGFGGQYKNKDGLASDAKGNPIVMGSDLATLTGIAAFLKQAGLDEQQARRIALEFSDGQGKIPYINNPGQKRYGGDTISMALLNAAERVTFGVGAGTASGSAAVGRTVRIELVGSDGKTRTVQTDESGAGALVDTLRASRLSAGG